jgi:hypothetical protein
MTTDGETGVGSGVGEGVGVGSGVCTRVGAARVASGVPVCSPSSDSGAREHPAMTIKQKRKRKAWSRWVVLAKTLPQ